ncbi:MAG: Rab family GTPase [Promethearchaeota archaeon]
MNEIPTRKFQFKIIIIGDNGVGKTSLVKNYVEETFTNDYKPTIGTNIFIKKLKIKKDEVVASLWDIAGQERWKTMRSMYYKGSQGVIIVGDLTRKSTFKNIEGFWAPDLLKNLSEIPIIIIANKNDLQSKIEVDDDTIQGIVRNIGVISAIKSSAKTGFHVNEAFILLLKKIIEKNNELINK